MANRPPPNDRDASSAGIIEPTAFRPPGALRGYELPAVPWVALTALATVALTGLIITYLLLARSVTVESEPVGADIAVAQWLAPRIGRHWLLIPGPHTVEATAVGYKPLKAQIVVTDETLQIQRIVMTPLPGKLKVSLAPATKASVRVDGKRLGTAPGLIDEIEAGHREIEISAPRYQPFTTAIEVRGKRLEESLDVKLTPAWADFTLASVPSGAVVAVDGKALGPTPYTGELIHGARKLTVGLKGYKTWSRNIEVKAGQAVDIPDVTLQKADGILEVVSNPRGAAVTVDGKFRGEAPLKIPVKADAPHRVTVMKAGYSPQSINAAAAPDAIESVTVQLEPELAVVNLMTEPADAELLVDGQPAGNATQRLSLPTHEHEIIVRKPGYATYRTIVTPRKGVDKHLRITLKTAAQMTEEEVPPAAAAPAVPPTPVATDAQRAPPEADLAHREADIGMEANPFIPDEIKADASAALRSEAASSRTAPRVAAPAVTAEGEIRTSIGQILKRMDGGDIMLPQRPPARLTRAFYIGVREVTNGEYRRFISSHVSRGAEGQELNADALPVVGVSWVAAATYCNWLSRRDSLPAFYQIKYGQVLGINPDAVGYRLPTEAEWDWAAGFSSSGKPLQYPWGEAYPPRGRAGNFADETGKQYLAQVVRGYDDGFAATAPVGSFPPNARGLYDLAGNVAEWMHDYFAPRAAGGVNPLGPSNAAQHVVRGSSWAQADDAKLRTGYREAAQQARPDLGFRIARYVQ